MGISSEKKAQLAAYQLKSLAQIWFEKWKEERLIGGPIGWEEFKAAFLNRFFPLELKEAKLKEFLNLKQGTMSVREYAMKFNTLSRYAPMLVADSRPRMNLIISGFSDLINKECQTALLFRDMDLARLITYCEQMEEKKLLKLKKGEAKRARYDGGYQGSKSGEYKINNQNQKFQQHESLNVGNQRYANDRAQNDKGQQGRYSGIRTNPKCQKCGKNHGEVYHRETGACFACGQLGHKISCCPKARDKGKGVFP